MKQKSIGATALLTLETQICTLKETILYLELMSKEEETFASEHEVFEIKDSEREAFETTSSESNTNEMKIPVTKEKKNWMPLASDRVAKLPNSRSSESEKLPRALQNEKGISYSKLQEEYNKLLFKKHQVWCRSFVIPKAFVGLSFQVHNGSKFVLLQVTEKIVGYRFGEFVPTRKVTVHKEVKKKK